MIFIIIFSIIFLLVSFFTPQLLDLIIPSKNVSLYYETLLQFYGSYLAFFGSFSLAVIALYQNNKLRKQNDKLQKLSTINMTSFVNLTNYNMLKDMYSRIKTNYNLGTIISLLNDETDEVVYLIECQFQNLSDFPISRINIKSNNNLKLINNKSINIKGNGVTQLVFILPINIGEIIQNNKTDSLDLYIDFINCANLKSKSILKCCIIDKNTHNIPSPGLHEYSVLSL